MGFHDCSTQELMAIITLLNYNNVSVREFILERTQEDILSGKEREEVNSLKNFEKMASIEMVNKTKNKYQQSKGQQGHVKGVGTSKENSRKNNEDKQGGEETGRNQCRHCCHTNHTSENCTSKPCSHCESNGWYKRIAGTHKTENCRNIQKIQEARDAETRAARIQGENQEDRYATDSDEGEIPSTHIGKEVMAKRNMAKDDEEDMDETAEQGVGKMNDDRM